MMAFPVYWYLYMWREPAREGTGPFSEHRSAAGHGHVTVCQPPFQIWQVVPAGPSS